MACLLVNVCMSFIDKVNDCFLANIGCFPLLFFICCTILQSNKEGVQSVYHASATEGHMQEILGTDYDDKFHKLQCQWSHCTSHHHCQTRLFMHTTYSAMTKVIDPFKLCHKKTETVGRNDQSIITLPVHKLHFHIHKHNGVKTLLDEWALRALRIFKTSPACPKMLLTPGLTRDDDWFDGSVN